MSIVHHQRPCFSEAEAARLAAERYGLKGTAQELPSERDQNFRLTDETGRAFVLKISNVAEKEEVLDFQNKAISHLQGRDPSILCPQVCPTPTGEPMTTVEGRNGGRHFMRLLTYLPGVFLGNTKSHSQELLRSLGVFLGKLSKALQGFSHPAMRRQLKWDLQQASFIINSYKGYISQPERRAMVEQFLRRFETETTPLLPQLRTSVIHNDANDYNLLVDGGSPDLNLTGFRNLQVRPLAGSGLWQVVGIIDFGDMLHGYTVSELAIGAAYAMLDKADPVAAAAQVVAGYHSVFPLTEPELKALYDLICLRLCMSVTISAQQQQLEPDNDYLKISERPAWALLERLALVNPQFAHYTFRQACGLPPCPQTETVVQWLKENPDKIGRVVEADLKTAPKVIFDLSVGSLELSGLSGRDDVEALSKLLFGRLVEAQAEVGAGTSRSTPRRGVPCGIGRYNEARQIYSSDLFKSPGNEGPEWRTVHLGFDLFMPPGSPVFAPLEGTIHSFQNNTARLDYGPTIIAQHEFDGVTFFTLYGHLSADSLAGLYEGKPVQQGEQIGRVGHYPTNGGWPPHLHFQLMTDILGRKGDFPGVALPSQREVWLSLCPDPNLILGLPAACLLKAAPGLSKEEILALRREQIGKSLSISYRKPLKIVRGFRQYLYDENGRAFLDAVNNVPHVGHCHPRVVEAAQRQMAALNTNTRYLHDNLVYYAQRLGETLPQPLRVCFFVCSGSEANDLALRLARTHTGQTDVIVVDGAYHGNLSSLIDISPYKFDGPGGAGAPPHVHKVIMPDDYRGPYRRADREAGKKYARHVQEAIEALQAQDRMLAAFFCESLLGCGGQIILPDGYLPEAYRYVRAAGGVCIADEVQVGFGRVGGHFWGFETQGVVPDIVTMGKPIGNGHPMAAVVTTPEIADSFNNGMEYFNTYGGNPVSCAVGLAVLAVIKDEKLQENALQVGHYLKAGLEELKAKYALIGDVRGLGLFIGVELVLDRETLAPAAAEASYIVERMKEHGILLSTDGPLHNVLKIKPPLVFAEEDADLLVRTLDKILGEVY